MRDLATYSFANAKIRAMLSYLIQPEIFLRLAEAKDIYEFSDILKDTPYGPILKTINKDNFALEQFEKQLLRNDLDIHRKVCATFSSKPENYFLSLLTQYYEIEELKTTLRIWHKKIEAQVEDYLLDDKISFDIDFKRIIYAPTIEEIILLLDRTPYKEPLMLAREKFKERDSSFYLEAALDSDYYRRLAGATERFRAPDKRIAQKILGVQIDIENINWLLRMRKYYSLGLGEMMQLLIPGGRRIHKDALRALYASAGIGKIVEVIARGPYAKLKELMEENIYFLEQFLYEVLTKEIKRALAGFPFTIGIALGYLILKRRETHNIVSLLYAKSLGLKREETEHLLNI